MRYYRVNFGNGRYAGELLTKDCCLAYIARCYVINPESVKYAYIEQRMGEFGPWTRSA